MAYSLEGSIAIVPPLNFAEIRTAGEVAVKLLLPKSLAAKHASPVTVFEEYMPLRLLIEETERETDEGVLKVRQARSLRPSHSSNVKFSYAMDVLVRGLVNALPGHNWDGILVAIHEDMADAERLVVKSGLAGQTVITTKGSVFLRWEDGSPDENLSAFR